MSESWFDVAVEVVCNNETVHPAAEHVAWIFPDAPRGVNAGALLVGNERLPNLKAALLRQASGEHVRDWYSFVCPICGTRGATPQARAEVLRPIMARFAALGVSRLDINSLESYISG